MLITVSFYPRAFISIPSRGVAADGTAAPGGRFRSARAENNTIDHWVLFA